ncbi:PI-PLC X domain-containing protein 1-like [Xyrichtys novacula]|uniref:PI-PLC X domain-containing protein 1-like n=1 Tax=Xyrichtys novacula TaxID=13765 RepID=A0AAV1H6K0_XYRNO|nr:PI-PLC X domain-containing protein 1-like [Xyrichtys novacula]
MAEKSKQGKVSREVTSHRDWMSQLPLELHGVPLFKLALPGSHDSMSYDLDINSSIIEPDRLKRFSRIYCARRMVLRWAVTQEETITKQLDAGVRYFDMRVARKPNDPNPTRLFFYHGLYTRTDVESVLRMVNEWAETHPKEILILALSHFKEMDKHLHQHLINFIKTLFRTKLFPPKETPTLKSCWDKDRNIIVSYDYQHHQAELWGKIRYFYGKSMNPAEVEAELTRVLEKSRPSKGFFVCGLNLTLPDDVRILRYILRLCDNLANVIQRSLPRLLQWVEDQAAKTPVNIIASDLVTRDDFVSIIIKQNIQKNWEV